MTYLLTPFSATPPTLSVKKRRFLQTPEANLVASA